MERVLFAPSEETVSKAERYMLDFFNRHRNDIYKRRCDECANRKDTWTEYGGCGEKCKFERREG